MQHCACICVSHCTIYSICHPLFFSSSLPPRNYNPVERRGKGGKDRNLRCSLKSSKSLQTNIMNNSGSGKAVNPNRTSGLLLGVFDPKLFYIMPDGFTMLIFSSCLPFDFSFLIDFF